MRAHADTAQLELVTASSPAGYDIDDYLPGPLTVTTGDLAIGFDLDDVVAAQVPRRAQFVERPGGRCDLRVRVAGVARPRSERLDEFVAFADAGFRFASATCAGSVDWRSGAGAFEVYERAPGTVTVDAVLLQIARATMLAYTTMHGGVMLHAASLQFGGRSHVICGPSGVGKSTLYDRFGGSEASGHDAAVQLGDEYVFLLPDVAGRWLQWWWSADRAPREPRPRHLPLGALLHFDSARDVTRTRPLRRPAAIRQVSRSTYCPAGVAKQRVLDNFLRLADDHPGFTFNHCLRTKLSDVADCIIACGSNP